MSKQRISTLVMMVACAATAWAPAPVRAGQCGSLTTDSGDNHIVLGEKAGYFWYQGQLYHYGLGDLAVCWLDEDSQAQYELFPYCDTSSSSGDYLYVSALGGDDVVGPDTEGHICKVGYLETYLLPFDEDIFDFYLNAEMGTGSDRAYGTGNGDVLFSNKYGTFPSNLLPADSAEDSLCGYGGNDSLYGDHDDSNTYEEILHGGAGSDLCEGGYDGNTYDWAHTSCETYYRAWYTGTDWGDCGAGADENQEEIWWF